MTKMADISIDIESNFKIYLFRTKKSSKLILAIEHCGWKIYQLCSKGNPRSTFAFFKAWLN